MSSASSRIAEGRPVPHIVTELPGPKARAHVAFDETWTSPSLPRAYPIVPIRGEGLTVEDIDGNLFLDFAAGIAVNSTGHSHPQVVAAIKEQAAELIHFSASDFYLPIYAEVCRRLAELAPIDGRARTTSATRARRRSRRRSSSPATPPHRPYVVAFLGAFHGRTYGAVSLTASKAKYHAGFGPLLPGVFHAPYGRVEDLRWFDERAVRQARARQRGRRDHRRADPGRGRLPRPRGRLPAGPARDLRQARHPAHRRRDPVRRGPDRQDVGHRALGCAAGHPPDCQGHRVGHAARRDDRPCGPPRGLGAGRPRHRRTAATRSPAPRRSRRSTCSKAASSPTPPKRGDQAQAGLAAAAGAISGAGPRRPRQGPDARRRVRHQPSTPRRSSGPASSVACLGPRVRQVQRPDVAGRSACRRTRWTPPCGSSRRRSPRSPLTGATSIARGRRGRAPCTRSRRPVDPGGARGRARDDRLQGRDDARRHRGPRP